MNFCVFSLISAHSLNKYLFKKTGDCRLGEYRKLPVIEGSFAKDNVTLTILPFMCIRGSVPLAEYRKIHIVQIGLSYV